MKIDPHILVQTSLKNWIYLDSCNHVAGGLHHTGSSLSLAVPLVLLLLKEAVVCNGGKTSSFTRKVEKSEDMPLHSDVFAAPSGYNAPQQKTRGDMNVTWEDLREGDMGQTFDSNKTFAHYESNPKKGQAVLYVGDLSYADDHPNHDNVRRDTWGRFVERSTASQPWIWTTGNHEVDFAPEIGEPEPFKPFRHRYHVPYKASGSTQPFWYSIKMASAHIIVLSSYSAYGKYTPQYEWIKAELPKVDRTKTPWLIVLMHSPWYNSYNYHYMEGESMRVAFEPWFVKYKIDVVFAGHVHAYERSDMSAPVYITIGDGGNIEGLATKMTEPQPEYSAYREASFGHAMFEIKNRTHAHYSWHRNEDEYAVTADSMWFFNRYWHPVDDSTTK
ncbi:hypothetical protein Fmac_019051 [Flemingia macrophylla]|uniref:acid phosphatase n=1 Tax=Flemingia macrophylla TaxID=520843 RepID=A0ABD1M6N8_9FABA